MEPSDFANPLNQVPVNSTGNEVGAGVGLEEGRGEVHAVRKQSRRRGRKKMRISQYSRRGSGPHHTGEGYYDEKSPIL